MNRLVDPTGYADAAKVKTGAFEIFQSRIAKSRHATCWLHAVWLLVAKFLMITGTRGQAYRCLSKLLSMVVEMQSGLRVCSWRLEPTYRLTMPAVLLKDKSGPESFYGSIDHNGKCLHNGLKNIWKTHEVDLPFIWNTDICWQKLKRKKCRIQYITSLKCGNTRSGSIFEVTQISRKSINVILSSHQFTRCLSMRWISPTLIAKLISY